MDQPRFDSAAVLEESYSDNHFMSHKPTTTDAEPTRLSDTDDHQPVPLAHRNADAELRVTMLGDDEDYTVALVPEDTPLGEQTDSVYRTDTTYDLEDWV